MSIEVASEHVCYVHCNFCNTILAVSVPSNTSLNIVTVRCGHCGNLLSVNMGASLQTLPPQDFQLLQNHKLKSQEFYDTDYGSSSRYDRIPLVNSSENDQYQMLHIRQLCVKPDSTLQTQNNSILPYCLAPEKRQRVPSAYNKFIKEEIQRIKASNPDISHREAFSAAAKNWAHFPDIHFGLNLDNNNNHNKQVNTGDAILSEGYPKSHGFY